MEHLDLAGVINAPINWGISSFDQQDALYLSNSRQMLEPILEETSEDEERAQNSWNQYESSAGVWSSAESETGSVIRIEVTKEADAISERDFACPAKRPRRSDEFLIGGALNSAHNLAQSQHAQSLDDSAVLLRRYQRYVLPEDINNSNSFERFLGFEDNNNRSSLELPVQRRSTGSRRFDDYYAESDSLSYQSLSRSSSLIQFESLERQLLLQEQHASMGSLGNSSPSLLSVSEATSSGGGGSSSSGQESSNNIQRSSSNSSNSSSRRGSQNSLLKRFESSDGRLHQTYLDLDKLNFDDDAPSSMHSLFRSGSGSVSSKHNLQDALLCATAELKSDSESSSTSSSSCSGESVLSPIKPSLEDLSASESLYKNRKISFHRGKSSVENLSEDSGYCEPSSLRRAKSKSIPQNFEKFCEEEEEFQNEMLNASNIPHGRNSMVLLQQQQHEGGSGQQGETTVVEACASDLCQPKIQQSNNTLLLMEAIDEGLRATTKATETAAAAAVSKNSTHTDTSSSAAALLPSQAPSTAEHCSSPQKFSTKASPCSPPLSQCSTSSSTCASAASFTWLPTQTQHLDATDADLVDAVGAAEHRRARLPSLADSWGQFSLTKRSSLPDIRDACTSSKQAREFSDDYEFGQQQQQDFFDYTTSSHLYQGYVLDSAAQPTAAAASQPAHSQQNKYFGSSSPSYCSATSSERNSELSCSSTEAELTPQLGKRFAATNIGLNLAEEAAACTDSSSGQGKQQLRIASEPNELHKLGGKRSLSKSRRKQPHWSNSSHSLSDSDDSEQYEQFGLNLSAGALNRMRRSCSWSERLKERKQQQKQLKRNSFGEGAFQSREKLPEFKHFMNASYQNLSLLDYSSEEAQLKRSGFENLQQEKKETEVQQEEELQQDYNESPSLLGKMNKSSSNLGDYEGIICKGNFLLDELSEIYDKNASIMNDRVANESELEQQFMQQVKARREAPQPPPRSYNHKKRSSSEAVNAEEPEVVQHVQLTLRKPPARQKRKGEQGSSSATNSLTESSNNPIMAMMSFSTFGKSFDQDPTNLKTSYAQSLEKCNFDAKELSYELPKPRALPKRRFQSQANAAKQRSLVSSTPNLNSFECQQDELEDDMYVSSAHTSMHQLPQGGNAKPLGILLPSGSRTSFGKEVSFCPVVSKYSWQEQSSEERGNEEEEHKLTDESDDELLDNADATVIHNTRENELIALKFQQEQMAREQEQKQESVVQKESVVEKESVFEKESVVEKESAAEKESAPLKERQQREIIILTREAPVQLLSEEQNIAKEQTRSAAEPQQLVFNTAEVPQTSAERLHSSISLKPTIVSETTTSETLVTPAAKQASSVYQNCKNYRKSANSSVKQQNASVTCETSVTATTNAKTAQASSNNNNNRPLSIQLPILSEPPTNRAHHILYASQQMLDNFQRRELEEQQRYSESLQSLGSAAATTPVKNMSKNSAQNQAAAATTPLNNNNDSMKSKFKADEKHPNSKGFLSRFAHGFRFSLRRNKKQKQLQQQQQAQKGQQLPEVTVLPSPLKSGILPPAATGNNANAAGKREKSPDFIFIPLKGPLPAGSRAVQQQQPQQHEHSSHMDFGDVVVAAMSQHNSLTSTVSAHSQQQIGGKASKQQHVSSNGNNKLVTGKPPLPPQQLQHQQQQQQQQQQRAGGHAPQSQSQFYADTTEYFLNVERSAYNDFENQLNAGMQSTNIAAGAAAARTANGNGHGKHIGLIETNLDTHETVIIPGKTRSLMDIGPQAVGKRLTAAPPGALGLDYDNDANDDNEVYLQDARVGSVLVKHATLGGGHGGLAAAGGAQHAAGAVQIASVRRPHKSMEFLLDKENQKNVLPPENELQKSHEQNPAMLSEHQLRIQASLQRLNIPDWFRQYNQPGRSPDGGYKPGNFTRKRTTESGRWTGLNSKTTSLSSLGSQRSDRSPLLLSPSAHSHHGGQTAVATAGPHYHHHHQNHASGSAAAAAAAGGNAAGFSRWSTSQLNSNQTSPSISQRGTFVRGGPVNSSFMSVASGNSGALRSSYRQPYLGWRSQEKLSQRTPHERLTLSLLNQQQQQPHQSPVNDSPAARRPPLPPNKLQPVTPEIQSSIKEVTSAIVHYVNDQTNQQRSRSASPNSRKCWLESSFVGIRPLDSPQTPIIESTSAGFAGANNNTSSNTAGAAGNHTASNSSGSAASSTYLGNSVANNSNYSNKLPTLTHAEVIRMNGLSCSGESAILI